MTYENLPDRYRAYLLENGRLEVKSISPEIYMRFGEEMNRATPREAIEHLRQNLMDEFQDKMAKINWQARGFGA